MVVLVTMVCFPAPVWSQPPQPGVVILHSGVCSCACATLASPEDCECYGPSFGLLPPIAACSDVVAMPASIDGSWGREAQVGIFLGVASCRYEQMAALWTAEMDEDRFSEWAVVG